MQLTTTQRMLVSTRVRNSSPDEVTAWLLWYRLGQFGAHHFYFHHYIRGVIMLLLMFLGSLLRFVAFIWKWLDLLFLPKYINDSKQALSCKYTHQILQEGRLITMNPNYNRLDVESQLLVEEKLNNNRYNPAVAWLLLLTLGLFGAHRFYLHQRSATVMLGLSLGSICLMIFGSFMAPLHAEVLCILLLLVGVLAIMADAIWWVSDLCSLQAVLNRKQDQLRNQYVTEILNN